MEEYIHATAITVLSAGLGHDSGSGPVCGLLNNLIYLLFLFVFYLTIFEATRNLIFFLHRRNDEEKTAPGG